MGGGLVIGYQAYSSMIVAREPLRGPHIGGGRKGSLLSHVCIHSFGYGTITTILLCNNR